MAAAKTLAFVLKTQGYRDTSLLATFYSRQFGKLKAVVKGIRDTRTRFDSTLEPFSLNEILVYRRKRSDLHLVTAAELVDRYEGIRKNLEHLGQAYYFVELVDHLTETDLAHEEIFDLLRDTLGFMMSTQRHKRVTHIFELKLMQRLGFLAAQARCVRCGRKDPDAGAFSIPSGGPICERCRATEGPLVRMASGTRDFLERASQGSYEELTGLDISPEVERNLERLMRQYVEYHMGYRARSIVFLEKIGVA